MPEQLSERTLPKPRGVDANTDPQLLAHGRYGTDDMCDIFGPEKTVRYILDAQVASVSLMSELYPEIVPPEHASELKRAAREVDMKRVREIESKKGHDVIAVNNAWEEKVKIEAAKAHINKARTSADSTETAKALQFKAALPVVIGSLENLRDITLERALEWSNTVNMMTTHLYDAAPAVAGRPFAFYAEMLQSDLEMLKWVYLKSLVGKWADGTGDHHSATGLGIDGMCLQRRYCNRLGIRHMTAPAQIPGREFLMDVIYSLLRPAVTMDNLAHYIRTGRGDDMGIFRFVPENSRSGSSTYPQKDDKGGNPTGEENTESFRASIIGAMATSAVSGRFDYGRDLSGSASDRLIFDDSFKWGDHVIRTLADIAYRLKLDQERCTERVERSYGVTTAGLVMTYLTDRRKTEHPMARKAAHDLTAELATKAYRGRRPFIEVLLEDERITGSLPEDMLTEIADPFKYVGQSREIVADVFKRYHGKKTLRSVLKV